MDDNISIDKATKYIGDNIPYICALCILTSIYLSVILISGGDVMAITDAQKKATAKYVKNNYDRIEFKVPKGRKAQITEYAFSKGESTNAFLNRLINQEIGQNGDGEREKVWNLVDEPIEK